MVLPSRSEVKVLTAVLAFSDATMFAAGSVTVTVNGLVMALPTSGDATTLKLNVPADSAAEVVITPLEDTAKLDASSPVSEYVSVPLPPRLADDVTMAAPLPDTSFVTLAMLVAGDASQVAVTRPLIQV